MVRMPHGDPSSIYILREVCKIFYTEMSFKLNYRYTGNDLRTANELNGNFKLESYGFPHLGHLITADCRSMFLQRCGGSQN